MVLTESPVNMPSPTKEKPLVISAASQKTKMMCPECLDEGGIFIAYGEGHRCGDCGRQAKYWDMQGREVTLEERNAKAAAADTSKDENSVEKISDVVDSKSM